MVAINKGDNTGAFGTNFLKIYLNNPNHLYIQRAIFQVNGDLEKEFIDPIFPIKVNFTGAETELLQQVNHCKLALWDGHGRRRTAEGKFTFFVKENRIKEPDAPDCMYEDISEEDNSIHFALDDAEFVAQFTVNATPSKMSELQQDIPIATFDKIKDGDNIHTFIDQDGNLVINAEVTTEDVEWEDIKHKPTINGQPLEGDVHIEVEQVNADWHASEGPAFIKNKPNFHRVAYTGFYRDLIGIPTVPSKTSQLEMIITLLINMLIT